MSPLKDARGQSPANSWSKRATANWSGNLKSSTGKRRWYQLHIRAKLLMVFSIVIMVLFNMRERPGGLESVPIPPQPGVIVHRIEHPTLRGWPFDYQKSFKGEYE